VAGRRKEEEVEGEQDGRERVNTQTSISIQPHMTTHTHMHILKDRRELTAGGGMPLSLDASGYFRRMF